MDNNATDPLLFALQRHESADVIELCRIFMLDIYLRYYGRIKIFRMLQFEYERKMWDAKRSVQILIVFFAFTWFLRSSLYNTLAQIALLPVKVLRILRLRLQYLTRIPTYR